MFDTWSKKITGIIAVIVAILGTAGTAYAATIPPTAYPANQIGLAVPFTIAAGVYTSADPATPTAPLNFGSVITSANSGCTWNDAANGGPASPATTTIDAVVYSFTTGRYGTEQSTNGGGTFDYDGTNANGTCG